MADTLKVELIARDFNRMLEELAAIDPKIEFRDVVTGTAARVVYNAMNRTRAAEAASIRRTWQEKEYTTFNGKRYKLSNHYPDALWGRLEAFQKDRLAIKLAMRGLSKQSFYWIAQQIGIAGDVPAYVRTANFKGHTYPQDGEMSESGEGGGFALKIINSSPIVQAAGGRQALLRAMSGETSYFRKNMEMRAFRTLESRAAKYPQIFARNTS